MDTLQFKIEETKVNTCFKFTGDINGLAAFNLKQELKKYVFMNRNLRLDLTDVNEISLTGLNSILISKAYANSKEKEVTLILNQDSSILKQLHLTKMTDQFIIEFAA